MLRPARISASIVAGSAVTHGMPSATELPKKISENDSPTTARMPQRRIACGACSRDDPQPKFAFDEQDRRARVARIVERMTLPAACELLAIVLEEVLSRGLRT